MEVDGAMSKQDELIKDLPSKYEHKEPERKWSAYWDEKGFFHSSPNPNKKSYTIVIPPPNVTGALHLGHALNDTLQDIMIRSKRMQGFETLWVPGVDHAGIATQAIVEKRLFEQEKKTRHDIGREALVQRIWDWKNQYQHRIIDQLKAMGCSCDWQRTRFTLDEVCAKAVRYFFFKLFSEDLIYRGKRLVNWDTLLQTAVSDDEVFHETIAGNFWYMHYPVIDPKEGEPEFVTVATTRPETMFGDTAVAVHPNPGAEFDRIEAELKNKIAAVPEKERAEHEAALEALEVRRKEILPLLIQLAEMAKDGRKVFLPLANRQIPLVADVWAKPELGTGCVKITPAHDPNDYEVGKRCGIPFISIMEKDGTTSSSCGVYRWNGKKFMNIAAENEDLRLTIPEKYRGLKMLDARKLVVEDLEKEGWLVKTEDRTIEISMSDRSKKPIEPSLNDQWFVKMAQLTQTAMDAVTGGEVRINPPRYAKGYLDWLSEKRDWPIGRQLWWGHRIPIWYCDDASQEELDAAFAGRNDIKYIYDDEKHQWWICSQIENLPEDAVPGHKLVQDDDVLDTWFSSGLWPHSTLGWPDQTPEMDYYYPTNLLITSRDIISLWVARMVLSSYFNLGRKPFDDVFIHPKILDKYGEGMSKSKGNGVDPVAVINEYGADSLRFSLTYLTTDNQDARLLLDFKCPHCGSVVEQTKKNRTNPRITCPKCKKDFSTQWAEKPEDKALPQAPIVGERFEEARKFCNKLWNAARFVMMNLEGFTPAKVDPNDFLLEDRWILSRLATVTQQVTDYLNTFKFSEAARTLYEFAWDEYCSFYLEITKARMNDPAQRNLVQTVLVHVLDSLVRLLHPIMPYVTEEIWQYLAPFAPQRGLSPDKAAESVSIAPWPVSDSAAIDASIEDQFQYFQELLRAVREVRARQNVPPKTEIKFSVKCGQAVADLLVPMKKYFQSMAGAVAENIGENVCAPSLSANVTLPKMEIFVDLADLIDVDSEIAKKEKELAKLSGFIKAKEAKLGSDFIKKAPPQVVEKERNALAEMQDQYATNETALKKLLDLKVNRK